LTEYDKCRNMRTLCDLISKEAVFPADFIQHLKNCELCFFWASHTLAAYKASCTINRCVKKGGNCPPALQFVEILLAAIRSLRTLPLVDRKTARSVQHLAAAELGRAVDAWTHINQCQFCRDYYYAPYDRTFELQKGFENAIRNGEEIRAQTTVEAVEISTEATSFGSYDAEKKPN